MFTSILHTQRKNNKLHTVSSSICYMFNKTKPIWNPPSFLDMHLGIKRSLCQIPFKLFYCKLCTYIYVYLKWNSTKLRWKGKLKKLESSKHETNFESLLIHMWLYVDIPNWRPHKGIVPNVLHAPHNGCNSLQTRFQNWKNYENLFQFISICNLRKDSLFLPPLSFKWST
jgi:hypothetical protein